MGAMGKCGETVRQAVMRLWVTSLGAEGENKNFLSKK